ncbi:glycosyltransferase [Providencia alcalifaciens]|uniref:glycosyltransferase n=1 Tax=Providencia TaxID=586 RepID=UPI00234A94A4|nr:MULTISPECIES: glycosyltransferase [Providencia]ELR5058920.1 glycosyltransferase [Providencia rettgeri]ELR5088329.1 glycosyltransferase [Providencia rettgeri]ELY3857880.1 glycosyltransferase [Providencia rettgeri]MDH2324487.1 glycosyltransferase [Providencia rettgeri]WOC04141.1 glycosyltransferase [Providencia sp. PROV024]
MKALFVHDHIFHYNNNEKLLFSAGKLNNQSFFRYLEHFNSLTILSRYNFVDLTEETNTSMNLIDDKRINFIPFENQSTFKNRFINRQKNKALIKNIISNFDAIILRVPSEISFLTAEVCRQENIPYVCEVVACPVDAMKGLNTLKSKVYLPIIKHSMISTVSNAFSSLYVTSHFLQKRYPTKGQSTTASNVEIDTISKTPKQLSKKEEYNIALIGNLDSDHKGYPILYKALYELDKILNFNINVLLIGSGSKYKTVHQYSNIKIIYTGNLKKNMIHQVLASDVDLYIQPSNQEGLPRATIEAMSHALPCIVSNVGGLPEIINAEYTHGSSDYMMLSNLILKILTNTQEYKTQSIANLQKSSNYLSEKLSPIRYNFYRTYYNHIKQMRALK